MKPLKYTVAALAILAAASFSSSAMAAGNGDVLLGIYDSANAAASFEVDLGSFGTLTLGETFNLGSAIESTFTESNASLVFNIAAGNSSLATTGGLASHTIAYTALTLPTNAPGTAPYTNINAEYTELNTSGSTGATTLTTGTSSTGTGFTLFTTPSGNAGGFQARINDGGGNYGYGSNGTLLDAFPSTDLLTFYTSSSTSTSPTAYGTFQFSVVNGSDVLTFDPVAAPEPSAYALGLCAVALFFVLRRRSTVA